MLPPFKSTRLYARSSKLMEQRGEDVNVLLYNWSMWTWGVLRNYRRSTRVSLYYSAGTVHTKIKLMQHMQSKYVISRLGLIIRYDQDFTNFETWHKNGQALEFVHGRNSNKNKNTKQQCQIVTHRKQAGTFRNLSQAR